MKAVSLFNPLSSRFHALENFKFLTLGQKITTIVTTIAMSVFTLLIGTAPTFRLLVGRFTKFHIQGTSHPKPLRTSAEKAYNSGLHTLNTKPVKSTSSIIDEELKNHASFQMTEGEKWLYKALGFPPSEHGMLQIREKIAIRIQASYVGKPTPHQVTREGIKQEFRKIAIEERLLSLRGQSAEQAEAIAWAKTNLERIHGLLECFSVLHKLYEGLFESKKKELAALLSEDTKEHPSLEEFFQEALVSCINNLIIFQINNYLTIDPKQLNNLINYQNKETQQRLLSLFDTDEKPRITKLAHSLTLDLILKGTPYAWYKKWKGKIIASLAQSNNIGEQSLGFGICEGVTLRLIKQELEDPDYLMKNLDKVIQLTPRDRFLQSRVMMFKKAENSDFTNEFLFEIGLRKPSIDDLGYHNEMCLRLRKSFEGHFDKLIRFCWSSGGLYSGVCRLAVHFKDERASHAMYVRHDRVTNSYRFFDANIGLVEIATPEELYESLGDLLGLYYKNIQSFSFARMELSN